LASAIRVLVGDEEMRRRAAALGERVRAEDGVGRAVDVFRRTVPPARATFAVPA
jgi:sterol 3beta-glucosyltransferase